MSAVSGEDSPWIWRFMRHLPPSADSLRASGAARRHLFEPRKHDDRQTPASALLGLDHNRAKGRSGLRRHTEARARLTANPDTPLARREPKKSGVSDVPGSVQ